MTTCLEGCEENINKCCADKKCSFCETDQSASGDTTADEEQEASSIEYVIETCKQTIEYSAGDYILTQEEFRNHIEEFTARLCPDVIDSMPTTTTAAALDGNETSSLSYYDDSVWQTFYNDYSCILCQGLLDPFNDNAKDGWDSSNCGGCAIVSRDSRNDNDVDVSSSTPPIINIVSMTPLEENLYCTFVFEYALVQCHQPELTCLEECESKRNDCYNDNPYCNTSEDYFTEQQQKSGADLPPDASLQCWSICDLQGYNPCVLGCSSMVGVDASKTANDTSGVGSFSRHSTTRWGKPVGSFVSGMAVILFCLAF